MKTNYSAFIIGGEGPDAWENHHSISAVDFLDASIQAVGRAEDIGGTVVLVEQNDYPHPEVKQSCFLPPTGWRCTRDAGHEGPCAAVPI